MTSLHSLLMFGRASKLYASIGSVIATHLLVEKAIEKLLSDAQISVGDWRFSVKLAEVRKLKPQTSNDWYWDAAAVLNTARNKAAHLIVENDELFPPDAAKSVEEFVGLVQANLDVEKWVGPGYPSKAKFERTAFAYFVFLADYAKLHVGAKPFVLSGFSADGEEATPDSWQTLFGE